MGRGSNTPGKSGGGKYGASKSSRGQIDIQLQNRDEKIDFIMNDLKVSKEEATDYADVVEYYTHKGYTDMRGGNNDEAVKDLEKFISKAPSYDGEIYRGIHFKDNNEANLFASQLQKGATIDMGGISSWSSNLDIAQAYAGLDNHHFLFRLKNKNGVGIDHLSYFQGEKEVLHSAKSKFKIKAINQNGNTYEVELQEV